MSTEMSAPSPLDLNGNVSDNWRKFLQRFKIYLLATEKDQKPVAQQTAIFFTCSWRRGYGSLQYIHFWRK